MSEYFRRERHRKDRDLLVDFVIYLFIVVIVGIMVVSLLGVIKNNINKGRVECARGGYSLNYCKLITR